MGKQVTAADLGLYDGYDDEGETENIGKGDSELTYIWDEDGVWLKVRPDWISRDRSLILDVKTTGQTANPADVGKLITNLHYEIQAVMYQRGVKAIEGIIPRFVFMVQETTEPYFCSFVELPEMLLDMGRQELEQRNLPVARMHE